MLVAGGAVPGPITRRIIGTYTKIEASVIAAMTLPKWPAEVNRASVETLAAASVTDGALTKQPDLNALLP